MKLFNKKGFTLIELLVVIAVLGTLAVVVLIAINPVQQLARARDAGRSSAIAQIGHAVEALATVNNGVYFAENATCTTATGWVTGCLAGAGEIQVAPVNSAYSTFATTPLCGGTAISEGAGTNGRWCYDLATVGTTTGFVVYTRAEATSNDNRCAAPATEEAFFVYSSTAGRGGLWCIANGGFPSGAAATVAGGATNWRN